MRRLKILSIFFFLLVTNLSYSMDLFLNEDTSAIPEKQYSNYKEKLSKSPLGAVVRSFLVPGLGQVYVEKYWKAPLFFAGAVVMYYYVFKHNHDYLDYSRQYNELKKINPNDLNLYFLKLKRENALDNRDISIFFLAGIYALSMLDAYVDAQLFNFNVDEKISFNFDIKSNRFALSFSLRR